MAKFCVPPSALLLNRPHEDDKHTDTANSIKAIVGRRDNTFKHEWEIFRLSEIRHL